ncbi:MAG: HD domain-containing protein [Eubacteriaceae bacterium]|jgi:hypothetical protein|nr:HD domain-containing protein [Eubacteriaceae bacterium]
MTAKDRPKVMTRQECLEMLQNYGTPKHVIAHCIGVAEVAVRVGKALNLHGYDLDIALTENAALLHDMARTEDNHWTVAADFLRDLGYDAQADIIEQHMFYDPFSPVDKITETDLVCLGDRLVKEGDYVGLDERMEYIMNKARGRGDEAAVGRIRVKKEELRKFISDIEDVIGCTIDDLMGVDTGE